uniref:Uncharacterized protein n=1 Tax=Nelumbo nucifera TaxID=4432 RepID=A0A822YGP1_NELNU|nr:TPA_asm: hypothetical protein HUJ06_010518 [Nelumbo nucifera]
MGFSLSPSSPFLSIDNRSGLRRCDLPIFGYSNPIVNFYISRHRRVCLSASVTERRMEASWLTPEGNASDDYGGWAVIETQVEKKKGSPTFLLASIGTSIAIALMAIAHFSLARNGFKFKFVTLQDLQGILKPSTSVSDASPVVSQGETEPSFDETSETTASVSVEKLKRIVIPVAADSVQQEALLVLKKLKVRFWNIEAFSVFPMQKL